MPYNPQSVLNAAADGKRRCQLIEETLDLMSPEELDDEGSAVERDAAKIRQQAALMPDAPWEPEPPPVVEPPPLGGHPVVPELEPFHQTIQKATGTCVNVQGDGRAYSGLHVLYGEWMGFSVAKQDPTNGVVGFQLDRCQVETGWAGDHKGWGVRGYDMAQFHYRDTNFICQLPTAVNIEHGNYQNIYGGGLLENCFWYGCPGQASQYVWSGRENESSNFTGLSGQDVAGDVVKYLNCQVHNCGSWVSGRASFAISMFAGLVGLVLENTLIQKINEPKTKGAVLFQGNGKQNLMLLNSWIYFTGTPDREAVQCTNAKNAVVDGGEFHQAKGFRFVDCGLVEFKGNAKGPAPVWVGKTVEGKVQWQAKTTVDAIGAGTIFQ